MRLAVAVAVAVLWMPGVFAQEPELTAQELKEIRELGEDMRRVSLEGHRASFRRQLLERGMPEETVDDFVEQVQRVFGNRPIVIKRQPYGSPDLDEGDRESALGLIEKIQDFHRWSLERRMESRMERFDNIGIPLDRPCRGCIDVVTDCMEAVDAVYDACLACQCHSLAYCQDIWLTLFDTCEALFEEQCEEDSC